MNPFDLSEPEFANKINSNPDAIVLDVRTAEEFADGHLPNAQNIDLRSYDFEEKIDALDINATYLVYCRSGARSASACILMKSKGFADYHNLVGGILGWTGEIIK